MTDQPNNANDQPQELSESASQQLGVGQPGTPSDPAAEPANEVAAQQPPPETPSESIPANTQADLAQSAETPAPPEEPAAEEPTVEEPTAEEPTAEEPTAEEPTAEEPTVEEPTVEEPPAEEPTVEEPAAEEPPAEAPPAGLPAETPEVSVAEAPAEPLSADAESDTDEPAATEAESDNMDWYILKVQSNREDSIREGLLRRVRIAGLEPYFGQVIVPIEKITEFKGGKKRVTKRKLYPGYLVVHMEINDDTWFLVRETPGIGDFTGAAGHPTPMLPHEVSRIIAKQEEKSEKTPKLKIGFNPGDQVKINEGTFENFEGEVDSIDQTNGQVTVMINIFGRSTPVTLEYWQIESV